MVTTDNRSQSLQRYNQIINSLLDNHKSRVIHSWRMAVLYTHVPFSYPIVDTHASQIAPITLFVECNNLRCVKWSCRSIISCELKNICAEIGAHVIQHTPSVDQPDQSKWILICITHFSASTISNVTSTKVVSLSGVSRASIWFWAQICKRAPTTLSTWPNWGDK